MSKSSSVASTPAEPDPAVTDEATFTVAIEPSTDTASQVSQLRVVDEYEFRTCGGTYSLDPETGVISLVDRTLPPSA